MDPLKGAIPVDSTSDKPYEDAREHLYRGRLWRLNKEAEEDVGQQLLSTLNQSKSGLTPLKREVYQQRLPPLSHGAKVALIQIEKRPLPLLGLLRKRVDVEHFYFAEPIASLISHIQHCQRIVIVLPIQSHPPAVITLINRLRYQGFQVITVTIEEHRARLVLWSAGTLLLTYEDHPNPQEALALAILGL